MRKLLLLLSLICTFNSLKAQITCDSLFGEWVFTRWHADQLFVDIEDYAATMKFQLQKFKDEHHGANTSAKDSLKIIEESGGMIKFIKAKGFMKFTLNKDYTFKWHGTVNDPDVDFTGTFKCNGDVLSLSPRKVKEKVSAETMVFKIISWKGKYLSMKSPDNDQITNSIFTFKRK